jgi:hypothetical protein
VRLAVSHYSITIRLDRYSPRIPDMQAYTASGGVDEGTVYKEVYVVEVMPEDGDGDAQRDT